MKSITAIAYTQGGRVMFTGPLSMAELPAYVNAPVAFDPTDMSKHGNRPIDKSHLAGIASYLEENEQIVLNSIVAYLNRDDFMFTPDDSALAERWEETAAEGIPVVGTVRFKPGRKADIGDGQHRGGAIERVLRGHPDQDDPVYSRLAASSINLNLVVEDNIEQREQDYVDLQRNSKPIPTSSAVMLDTRQEINQFVRELARNVDLFSDPKKGPGQRIEYLSNTVGKTKPKLYTLQSLRYAVGTAMIGFTQRSTRGWEQATNNLLANQHQFDAEMAKWVNRFDLASRHVPGWKEIVEGAMSVPDAREKYVSCTGAGFTALMGALHAVENADGNVEQAIVDAGEINWQKAGAAFFDGTLLDDGKVLGSRNAFEAASRKLAEYLAERQGIELPSGDAPTEAAAA